MIIRSQTEAENASTPARAITPVRNGLLQLKRAWGGAPGLDGECEECGKSRLGLQRWAIDQTPPSQVPPMAYDVLRSPGQPLDTAVRASFEPRFGHDFSKVSVHGSKISGSGTGTVSFTYAPEPKDQSSKIVFIQVIQMLLDGKGEKPSTFHSSLSYRDPDTTGTFRYVDYLNGEKDPYYNGDDPADIGTQGNATLTPKVNATMNDTPHCPDSWYPAGKKKATWNFRTAAFSAAGKDQGTFYEYINWVYEREKGKAETNKIGGTGTGNPGKDFTDALDLWDKNHGFKLPTTAAAPVK
jgi:hypothetical protein